MTTADDLAVLCTGDLHLGRHPTRIPEELDGRQFSPAAVWEATVDEAIDRDVDAVLVSGDVVDRENRYVEAYGDFERGATRLADTDVPLVAVAGNHDHDTLPELIGSLEREGVELLGAAGTWERQTIRDADGDPLFHVDGWSFPNEHVLANPLADYDPDALSAAESASASTDAPVVGLLHADLDAQNSDYAPVATTDLRRQSTDAWILGHIHAPGVRVDADPLAVYPGSPQPLDPGEPGAHGPWLLTGEGVAGSTSGAGRFSAEQLPLATLRYDRLAVDVADAETTTDVTPAVHDRLQAFRREDVRSGQLELLLAEVALTGRTEIHAALADDRAEIERQLGLRSDGLAVRIERLRLDTRPAVDLSSLVGDETPVAYLAELLLALESEESEHSGAVADREALDEYSTLVDDALDRLRVAYSASAYSRLHQEGRIDHPDREDAVERLQQQARLLLDELLDQREARR